MTQEELKIQINIGAETAEEAVKSLQSEIRKLGGDVDDLSGKTKNAEATQLAFAAAAAAAFGAMLGAINKGTEALNRYESAMKGLESVAGGRGIAQGELQKALDGVSRNRAKAILTGGGIRVDKKIVKQYDLMLQPGNIVEISKKKPKEELRNKFVKIVYEDHAIVVVEKNIGILSMASSHHSFSVKTVLDEYFRRTHQKCTAHVVHRLDRDTSGLMVYAKTIEAEQILEHNWHQIVTDRRYVALCSGAPKEPQGRVESWLKDNKAFFTFSSPTDNGGKYALTHYKTLRSNERYSLVEFKLETGRKNQIRVHTQDLGCPICGDIKYGNGDNPIGRLALHAFRLNFYHPITNEQLYFETTAPKAFMKVFETQTISKKFNNK